MDPKLQARNTQTMLPLHPVLRTRFGHAIDVLAEGNIPVLVYQGKRTWDQQAAIWAKGRSAMSDVGCEHSGQIRKPGSCPEHPLGATVSNAQPGFGWHEYALALDAAPEWIVNGGVTPDWHPEHPAWQRMLMVARGFHLAEGAQWRTFKDFPHFYPEELPATPPDEVRAIYSSGAGLPGVWSWAEKRFKGATP